MSLIETINPSFLSGFSTGFASGVVLSSSGLLPIGIGIILGTIFGDSIGIKNVVSQLLAKFT